MRTVFYQHTQLTGDDRGASAAIGNFDGVHLGHKVVLDIARDAGAAANAPWGVLTFEPHPREYFAPDAPPFRLMNSEAKAHRLEKLGADRLFQLPFDAELAALSADAFARDILATGLGLRHVVVGADFRFGKGRAGDAAMLEELGAQLGFGVTVAPLLKIEGAAGPVSSTRIREALTDGRPEDAKTMLGHWHRIEGPVVHGEKRGRDLGFPTANISIDGLHPPKHGVYAVLVHVQSGPHAGDYHGVASLGTRPTFGDHSANLETFLFDFDGDLYGTHLSVALVAYLRPERRFDDIATLIDRMREDSHAARAALATL